MSGWVIVAIIFGVGSLFAIISGISKTFKITSSKVEHLRFLLLTIDY